MLTIDYSNRNRNISNNKLWVIEAIACTLFTKM